MIFKLIIDKQKEESVVATVHERSALTDKLEELVLESGGKDKIIAYTEEDVVQLPTGQIECVTVLDGKTYAIAADGKRYRLKQRLYELEAVLPGTFFRINKSTIANEALLERFSATYSGGINARFRSGYEEYVSRRCFAEIKRRFGVK